MPPQDRLAHVNTADHYQEGQTAKTFKSNRNSRNFNFFTKHFPLRVKSSTYLNVSFTTFSRPGNLKIHLTSHKTLRRKNKRTQTR